MYDFLKALSLPPSNLVLVILLGLLLRRRARRTGTAVAAVGAVALYMLSTSFVATRLLLALEADVPAPPRGETVTPQAIVILSAGYSYLGVKRERVDVDAMTLERLRRGARLHRETGLPILVTGDGSKDGLVPVGTLMARTLREDFGIAPKWLEARSATTYENAAFSARILKKHGISGIYLVSQAWHLPRAVAAFEAVGLSSIAVPSSASRPARVDIHAFIPSAKALQGSYHALHERLGLFWYRWTLFGRD